MPAPQNHIARHLFDYLFRRLGPSCFISLLSKQGLGFFLLCGHIYIIKGVFTSCLYVL